MGRDFHYSYEADWRPYAFPEDESHLASEEELEERYTAAVLEAGGVIPAAGIPILSDGKRVVMNTENEMNIVFGATGSKKSRLLVAPFACICAQARESMIISDVKGELSQGALSAPVMGILKEKEYNIRIISFRDFDCDGLNILLEPYLLYREGKRDEAMAETHKIVSALADTYHGADADPFWKETAAQYLMAIVILLYECCDEPEKINMLSLAAYAGESSCEDMQQVAGYIRYDNNIMTMLRNVLSEPEKTRMSTLATVNSFFSDFVINEKLLKMLSTSTFDLAELYREKTALFLIMPDETDAFSGIAGLILSQISSFLVREAYRFGGSLPRRVNYICDEFANFCHIPNMAKNISAHRSRNIRWTLVCQSRKQLEMAYGKDAYTILANCTNLFFLSSPETELLEELSARAGDTRETADGQPRPLVSVAALRGMKKGWEYTDMYFASGSTVCVSRLPDISLYGFVSQYTEPGRLEHRKLPKLTAYTSRQMLADIKSWRDAYEQEIRLHRRLDVRGRKAAERYRRLFNASHEESGGWDGEQEMLELDGNYYLS